MDAPPPVADSNGTGAPGGKPAAALVTQDGIADSGKRLGGTSATPAQQAQQQTADAHAPARHKAKTYIPSGTFFKARLLASLDAPTGGIAQSNPLPMLLMVTDNAYLPNRFRSKVKECRVLASGYGDLSSERVMVRTEKLSCVLKDGTVVDTKLDGYAAGEDGKNGVRGNVVSKQGAELANALLAGALGGLGTGLASSVTSVSQSGLGGAVTTVQPDKAMGYGAETGVGNALNKLANFYLNAAAKVYPIIEVGAGREVTVVLLDGLDIDAEPTTGAGGTTPPQDSIVTDADRAQARKASSLRGPSGDNTTGNSTW